MLRGERNVNRSSNVAITPNVIAGWRSTNFKTKDTMEAKKFIKQKFNKKESDYIQIRIDGLIDLLDEYKVVLRQPDVIKSVCPHLSGTKDYNGALFCIECNQQLNANNNSGQTVL